MFVLLYESRIFDYPKKKKNHAIVKVKIFKQDIEILPYIHHILSHDDLHKIKNSFTT